MTQQQDQDTSFSTMRNIFWPIKREELSKFIPISILMFCLLFNQNVLRILKDSILISEISAEVMSFTKLYCVTPMAAIFVIIYSKMINSFSINKIFYYLLTIFTCFYLIFAFIIYPNVHIFHVDQEKLNNIMNNYPYFKWYIAMIGNWSYVVFYTLSELWADIFYVLLFWQIANEVTSTKEAKRFYTFFSLFGNSSLLIVGAMIINLSSSSASDIVANDNDHKIYLVQAATALMTFFSILSSFVVRHISGSIICHTAITKQNVQNSLEQVKLTISESFKYIMKSKYLWLILLCTASFGFSINLVEAVWKSKMKELYPTVTAYAKFNSWYILWTGLVIMVMTIIGNNIMRQCGWFVTAIISPIVIMITGSIFFLVVVFDNEIVSIFDSMILVSPLAFSVIVGAVQNILAKGSKFSLWDTSKQMLYIPLDKELRTKGKAAVDVLSPKIGKSLSAFVQSFIFTIVPSATYNSITSLLMVIFLVICATWIYAIRKIDFEYKKIS